MPLLNNSSSYTVLGGDLGGTANDGKVLNISNVTGGVLGVEYGGTGLDTIDFATNGIFYWNGGQYTLLTGSVVNDVLYWDGTSWQTKEDKSLLIPSSFFDIFNLPTGGSLFISTPIEGGDITLRSLETEDLPGYIEDKTINNSSFQGTFNGAAEITDAIINYAEIASGLISGELSGDGSGITNLNAQNIENFASIINDKISEGNGIVITDVGNNIQIALSDDITINSISSSNIYSNNISGSGAGLFSIPNSALDNPYLVINGLTRSLGEELYLDDLIAISSSDENIVVTQLSENTYNLNLNTNINVESVYSDNFYGSGEFITDLQEENVSGRLITQNNSFVSGTIISFSGSDYVTASYVDDREIIGVVVQNSSTNFRYKSNSNVFILGTTSYPVGTKIYVDESGSACLYSDIPSQGYAKYVGIKTENNTVSLGKNKILKVWK
jgi:hypothetical protein